MSAPPTALSELREIAARARTRPILAAVSTAEGTLAAASGDHDAARRSLEDALDLLAACEAPFETGRVRLDLAATLDALGRPDQAQRQIEAAIENFRAIGADWEHGRAEAMLEKLRTPNDDAAG